MFHFWPFFRKSLHLPEKSLIRKICMIRARGMAYYDVLLFSNFCWFLRVWSTGSCTGSCTGSHALGLSAAEDRLRAYVGSNSTVELCNLEGLVCGCMDSYDSEERRILQHFSRSTRFALHCTFEGPKWKKAWKKHPEKLEKSNENEEIRWNYTSPT